VFKGWLNQKFPVMFIPGNPGVGKSYLSSNIIAFLKDRHPRGLQHPSKDTAESEFESHQHPQRPDSVCENTTMQTANSIQAISCSATVEEDSVLALAERQLGHNRHDTSLRG
jgi:hypothetical protein